MTYSVDVVFPGFSAVLPKYALGWSTVALIRDGKRNILLDTGLSSLRMKLPLRLRSLGIQCEDIDAVLLTHLHHDHAANIDLFPNAELYFAEEDYLAMCRLSLRDCFAAESALFLMRGRKVHLVCDGEEIFPDISVLFTPGHTRGSVSYIVANGTASLVLAGDALKNRAECKTECASMTIDHELSTQSIKKIKERATRILPGHDCWLEKTAEGTFAPLGGNDVEFCFQDGMTANGGKESITITLD